MPTNLVGEERLTLTDRSTRGDVLTIPAATNGAVINILKGRVRFTLDATDPAISDGNVVYRGQSINLSRLPNIGSIIQNLRIIPLSLDAQIVAWYFD